MLNAGVGCEDTCPWTLISKHVALRFNAAAGPRNSSGHHSPSQIIDLQDFIFPIPGSVVHSSRRHTSNRHYHTMRYSFGLAALAAVATASDVHELTKDTFEPFVKEHDLVLAECECCISLGSHTRTDADSIPQSSHHGAATAKPSRPNTKKQPRHSKTRTSSLRRLTVPSNKTFAKAMASKATRLSKSSEERRTFRPTRAHEKHRRSSAI